MNKEKKYDGMFELIKKANEKMPTINYQGKPYVQVKDRIVAFRSVFPLGKIATSYEFTDNYVIFEAIVSDEFCNILATGHARLLLSTQKCIEKCESTAIGRALAMIGFGTSESIASYDEMQDMADEQIFNDELIERDKKRLEEATRKFDKLSNTQKANILNLFHTNDLSTISIDTLEELIRNAK